MSILHTWVDGNYISGCDKNINVGIVKLYFLGELEKITVT